MSTADFFQLLARSGLASVEIPEAAEGAGADLARTVLGATKERLGRLSPDGEAVDAVETTAEDVSDV